MSSLAALGGLGLGVLKANLLRRRVPIFLSLFITNRCNLRCRYCFVSDADCSKEFLSKEYSLEEVKRIVDEFYAMGTRMIFLLGGEPLVHRDIGGVIDHIAGKGIYLHVVTNGLLIERRLADLKRCHVLCVSLDGVGAANDSLRGSGVFDKAVSGIRAATGAGIRTRVHAVLNRHNLRSIKPLAEVCRDLGVELTVSPPNFLGETGQEYMRISRSEYREFWKGYLKLYEEGYPIGNSPEAIRLCRDWPADYHRYIRRGERFAGYKPTFCLNGRTYVALGADGTMYNCINLGCTHGPNIKEHGIRGAWDRLLEWRPDCVSCSSINCIETAHFLELRLSTILRGFEFHRGA